MSKTLYQDTPHCKHILSDTRNKHANNSTIQEQHTRATLVAYDIATLCKSIAIKGQDYCRHHITAHSDAYARYQAEQNAKRKTTHDRNTHSDELRTLSTLLNKLTNKTGAYENALCQRIIALLRKLIDKIDMLRKAQRNTLTQDQQDALAQRIADMICAYVPDKRNEIRDKLLLIAREYAEQSQGE